MIKRIPEPIYLKIFSILIGSPLIALALVQIGRMSGYMVRCIDDVIWLSLIGMGAAAAMTGKDWWTATLFSMAAMVFAYTSQILALSLLETTYLLSDHHLLDESWAVSTLHSQILIFAVLGITSLMIIFFLIRKRFAYVALLLLAFSLPNYVGYQGLGEQHFDSPSWKSIARICRKGGLFKCIWERSQRSAVLATAPLQSEVEAALSILEVNVPDQAPASGDFKNIYYISLESAFDFFPLWKDFPDAKSLFPSEYLEWTRNWGALTAPGFVESGSFNSRFVSLCGSYYAAPPSTTSNLPCLPRALTKVGYRTSVFDEAIPTYDLDVLYSRFGFSEVNFFRHKHERYEFYEQVLAQIDFNSDHPKFIFIFPFTGHHGHGMRRIEDYEPPRSAAAFTAALDNRDAIASAANGLHSAVAFAKAVLEKDPRAIIVFRNDHLLPSTTQSTLHSERLSTSTRNELENLPPFLQRFMIVSADRESHREYSSFVSPQSIPLILLKHAGVAPQTSPEGRLLAALDCAFEGAPEDYLCDYETLYRQNSEGIHPLDVETANDRLALQHQAKKTLSLDLYFGQQYSYPQQPARFGSHDDPPARSRM